ncbi:MAG: BCSC C-terminal domain-containing protein [Alphaproteobacteria bacterium]|nr:BCSC C-terminal domain-containing protein [Alphaproteobacteria bacterium]MBV9860835.1 BCSC C-terminal domain-containing protein [Alphaproteobacteria bacterium]
MKPWARELALGLLLSAAIPSLAATAADPAEQILLDKANFWRLKDRPDLAVDALNQLLTVNPNQPDALYQYGMIEAQRGNVAAAQRYLARLRVVAPSSPHLGELESAVRAGQVNAGDINEARRLAQTGQFAQATQKYQQSFRGPPPGGYGLEYYQTLAGTPQGWDEARRGLERLVQTSPNDPKLRLALAQVLTYRDTTRFEGIQALARLSRDPAVGAQAAQSWRQALMWLGGGPRDRQLYDEYLAQYPQDMQIRQHMADMARGGGGATAAPAPTYPRPPRPAAASGGAPVRYRVAAPSAAPPPASGEFYGEPAYSEPSYGGASYSAPSYGGQAYGAQAYGEQAYGEPVAAGARGGGRAEALRTDAKNLEARGDAAQAMTRYQRAIATDPRDPWVRLDFARFLARQGEPDQAYAIVDPSASGNTPDSWHAAALFDSEQNRYPEALAKLERIPPGSRTPAIEASRQRIQLRVQIARAEQLARSGNRAAARNMLLQLYSQPPMTEEKARLIAESLGDIGDVDQALQIDREVVARGGPTAVPARIDYAALLVRAHRYAEAAAIVTQLEAGGRLNRADIAGLERLKSDIAAARADDLRRRGDVAGAYDQVSGLLAAYPHNPNLLMVTGRIYAAAGQNAEAMSFFDAAYRERPDDVEVIRGAVGGAIQAGDFPRARAYLAHGMELYPNSPRLYFLEAELARADGDTGTAMRALQIARALDLQHGGDGGAAPGASSGTPGALPPNPFRSSDAGPTAAPAVAARGSAGTAGIGASGVGAAPSVELAAIPADSDDLTVPPHLGERPGRDDGNVRAAFSGATPDLSAGRRVAQAQAAAMAMAAPESVDPGQSVPAPQSAPTQTQLAQLEPLPPPPIQGSVGPGFARPNIAPAPQDSLELDIQRSMAAIQAENNPTVEGGLSFRARSGETGLSRLTDVAVPVDGSFSPFYAGTLRLAATPEFLTAGTPSAGSLPRFGSDPLLLAAYGPNAVLTPAGDQSPSGVALSAGYAYRNFSGEIGTSPLGFPVENLVGRLAFAWPGPAGNQASIVYSNQYNPGVPPRIALAPTGSATPFQVRVEASRQPITDSVLSYAGTKDPLSGVTWGGVVRTGGDALVSYDNGPLGVYIGGGGGAIDGKDVESNSEFGGFVGGFIRPYRSATDAFKVGVNLTYFTYDKNLRFFTLGQGGYFSPQNYLNFSIPLEYSGRSGRLTYLAAGSIGIQNFSEHQTPFFPTNAADQAALEAALGPGAFYSSRSVTGPSFGLKGQIEYELNNGFSVGGLASVDNAENYTEGIAKVYLRKTFGLSSPTGVLPYTRPGSL